MPSKRRRRWSVIIESETAGVHCSRKGRGRFWLMLVLAVVSIAATLAVGAGLFPF